MPSFTAFTARIPVGIYDPAHHTPSRGGTDHDWILSRILWLEGMETGKNRRGHVDTKSRFIYIHGTHDENRIGTPASHGCIRMRNADVLELFEHTHTGEMVHIIYLQLRPAKPEPNELCTTEDTESTENIE